MSFLSSSSSSVSLASGSVSSVHTLHPIFLKKPSLEADHDLLAKFWSGARKVGMVAIACIGCSAGYLAVRLKNRGLLPLNKFIGAYSLACLGFAFLCLEALFSEHANIKIAHHQKKHQFQLDFRQIQNLGDEQFRAILLDEISLTDAEVDNLLNKASREQIIPSIIRYRRAEKLLDKNEEALKQADQKKQLLIDDMENKIKDGAASEIEKAFAALMAKTDDLIPTWFKPQILNVELKIEKAFIRTVFQSPGYTGDLNGMLVLGFIPRKELTTAIFNDGFIKQMLILSAIDPTYDPIALKHHQTGQTISVKAIARLADFEDELARFLFSDPNGFTPRYSYQKHITAQNFEEAFAGSYRSPTISLPLPEPAAPTAQSLEDSLLRVDNWGMASSIGLNSTTS